jgi:hypothetical protein
MHDSFCRLIGEQELPVNGCYPHREAADWE